MFVFVRAIAYAVLFVALMFIYVPGRLLSRWGIKGPAVIGPAQVFGMIIAAGGAALASGPS